jgi:hypothetical protein
MAFSILDYRDYFHLLPITLQLWNIPHSDYVPETMPTRLSALTSLETFWLGFQSPRSRATLIGKADVHLH